MKIAIVGPTFPYKGGIARHTTELARRLTEAGYEVEIVSWRAQWPFFYPGQQKVTAGQPEIRPFEPVRRVLSWKNPLGWPLWGRYLRRFDHVILVWWVPTIQGPIYLAMLRAMGRRKPFITVICHNVLPHEPRRGDKRLTGAVLRRADQVIVHNDNQATIARQLTGRPATVLELPIGSAILPGKRHNRTGEAKQLFFFGVVRHYKGVDVLIKALAKVPGVHLTVAGEIWGGSAKYQKLIDDLGLQDRVKLDNRYLPEPEMVEQIRQADAVVLPYRGGTATWNAKLAHVYGTPVIATTAASMASQVQDGVDGLLCKPDDVDSLAASIKKFYEPGTAAKLRRGVPKISPHAGWQSYVAAVTKSSN